MRSGSFLIPIQKNASLFLKTGARELCQDFDITLDMYITAP